MTDNKITYRKLTNLTDGTFVSWLAIDGNFMQYKL